MRGRGYHRRSPGPRSSSARARRGSRARRSRRRPCRRTRSRATARGGGGRRGRERDDEDDPGRVVRRAQQLERDVDEQRAHDHPAEAAGAAEDQHRVDRDQQRRVEVAREHGRVERREQRPVSPATPAPNANATSFNRLTGIPISSAASESSRSERHARPVREMLTR